MSVGKSKVSRVVSMLHVSKNAAPAHACVPAVLKPTKAAGGLLQLTLDGLHSQTESVHAESP